MKKLLAVTIILLFLSVSVIPSTGTTDVKQIVMPINSGNILYVGGSGPNNYTKIQDAIDDASDGDTVFVYDDSAPYYENLVVDKSINLTGENKETTIVDGQSNGDVMNVVADYVKISKFTIQNSRGDDYKAGISIRSNSSLITGNIFTENYHSGLYMEYGHNNTIIKNTFTRNENYGIHLRRKANNNLIAQNTITDNGNDGILVILNSGNIITNNTITTNVGRLLLSRTSHNIVSENNISYNEWGGIYFFSIGSDNNNNIVTGNKICNNQGEGMLLSGGVDNIISDNLISYNTQDGIRGRAYHYNIYNNTISNNHQIGIYFDSYCDKTSISGNRISNNNGGLYISSSDSNNVISDNSFINDGLFLKSSFPITINNNFVNDKPLVYLKGESNKIIDNAGQIILVDCNQITIQKLDLSNTTASIQLFSTDNCQISDNELSNSIMGLYLIFSTNNIISRNNFINNRERNIYFKLDYLKVHSNKWRSNYFDNNLPFLPKILIGSVKTRFSFPGEPGGPSTPIYRPGINIDWNPALKPYDI